MDGLTGFSTNKPAAESSFFKLDTVATVSKTRNQKCKAKKSDAV